VGVFSPSPSRSCKRVRAILDPAHTTTRANPVHFGSEQVGASRCPCQGSCASAPRPEQVLLPGGPCPVHFSSERVSASSCPCQGRCALAQRPGQMLLPGGPCPVHLSSERVCANFRPYREVCVSTTTRASVTAPLPGPNQCFCYGIHAGPSAASHATEVAALTRRIYPHLA
jgi:hypothetical protein